MIRITTLVAAATLAVVSAPALGDIVSTFDSGTEGWGTLNDATNFQWTNTLGNPAGAIRANDQAAGQWWYFSASSAYLGNKSAYYGGTLSWDIALIQGNHNNFALRADVMLVGGGLAIGLDSGVSPLNGTWTSWSVTFDTSQDWRIVNQLTHGTLTANVVTEAQFQTVLANLTGLYIRGEYTSGADASVLDNVSLIAIPAPGALALLAVGFAATGRRRRPTA